MTPMHVPFQDLKQGYAPYRTELDAAIARVLDAGWFVLGEEVETFERSFAAYCEAPHCVSVANGLDALQLALRALGVQPGDEVIVPSNTYIATWLAVSACGARPVPVEPQAGGFNIDPVGVERAVTEKTRVILPVHLYGVPADLHALRGIAERHGLRLLEDAAQAHGARYRGRRIGAHADAVAWSFYPAKNLGAFGDGGAVTTPHPQVASAIALMRNYGSRAKYVNEVKGVNSRLDSLQAAILGVHLRHLDAHNAERQRIANRYLEGLRDAPLLLPQVPSWVEPVWHQFVVRVAPDARAAVMTTLRNAGVGTLIHYPIPPHLQQAYADLNWSRGRLPLAEALADEVLSLPIWPGMTDPQLEHVIAACRALG